MDIIIPGFGELELKYLVLDYNGTIAHDGFIIEGVKPLLQRLSDFLEIYVLTADTFGTATAQCEEMPVRLHCLKTEDHTAEKADFVKSLGASRVVALGNGRNDLEMLAVAGIGIGVFGREGCASQIWQKTDCVVPDILDGLELLVNRKRLVATLRQ